MKPFTYPLIIHRGKRLDFTMTWRDKDGEPVDLTGCHAKLYSDSLPELSDEPGKGITLGGEEGTIRILVTPTATKSFDEIEDTYELIIEAEDDESVLLLEGPVEVV